MGRIVIACYRAKPGRQESLRALVLKHVTTLPSLGLATSRTPIVMQAKDGTFIEVFEWASIESIDAAHGHPVVQTMWEEFGKACEYVPVAQVAEASHVFSEFTPVEVS